MVATLTMLAKIEPFNFILLVNAQANYKADHPQNHIAGKSKMMHQHRYDIFRLYKAGIKKRKAR